VQREFTLDARCPACGASQLTMRSMAEDLPYFGQSLITTLACAQCGLRHTTTMVLEQHAPRRATLRFRAPEDLSVRVVRSDSCSYTIPELGFKAEPSTASEAFVTNLEGILERVRDVLVRTRLIVDRPEARAKAEELLDKLQRIQEGREPATLVLDDPYGNSQIASDRAVVEELGEEEARSLATGRAVLDVGDVDP
jgi:zinc finger protein